MDWIIDYMTEMGPVKAALIATLFTWFLTAAGASLVFFFKDMHRKWFDGMLGVYGRSDGCCEFLVAAVSCHRNVRR